MLQRHFSAFPLTSHLHTPAVRLVSLHPLLSVSLACLRVPEVHDDFVWRIFVARVTSTQEVIDQVVDELGLTKALPVPGGGNLDYVMEEAWNGGDDESEHPLLFLCDTGLI
jgi:diaphanous 1